MAIEILDKCYKIDWEQTFLILTRKIKTFNGRTCLDLALESDSLYFLSHISSQKLMDFIWAGHIHKSNSSWKITCAALFPPLLFAVKFRSKNKVMKICLNKSTSKVSAL